MVASLVRIALQRTLRTAVRLPTPKPAPFNYRRFASHSTLPTANGPIKVIPPDLSAIRDSEYFDPDVQLINEDEAKLNLTEAAVKVGGMISLKLKQ